MVRNCITVCHSVATVEDQHEELEKPSGLTHRLLARFASTTVLPARGAPGCGNLAVGRNPGVSPGNFYHGGAPGPWGRPGRECRSENISGPYRRGGFVAVATGRRPALVVTHRVAAAMTATMTGSTAVWLTYGWGSKLSSTTGPGPSRRTPTTHRKLGPPDLFRLVLG